MKNTFVYPVKSYEVTDGDTVKVSLDLGFDLSYRVAVRVQGVDTPEPAEISQRSAARVATAAVRDWLSRIKPGCLKVESIRLGKYAGRIIGDLVDTGRGGRLSAWLLDEGFAKPYDGGKKQHWTDEELLAIERKQRWMDAT